jgi:hypothetical protein
VSEPVNFPFVPIRNLYTGFSVDLPKTPKITSHDKPAKRVNELHKFITLGISNKKDLETVGC